MKVSDEDRNRAVEELRRHCSAGRLGIDDYAGRVAEAAAAETLADLDRALRDLPRVRIADPVARPPIFARASASSGPRAGSGPGAWTSRLVLVLSALVIAVGAVLLVLAQWVWATALVAGWVVGVVTGRVPLRRRS